MPILTLQVIYSLHGISSHWLRSATKCQLTKYKLSQSHSIAILTQNRNLGTNVKNDSDSYSNDQPTELWSSPVESNFDLLRSTPTILLLVAVGSTNMPAERGIWQLALHDLEHFEHRIALDCLGIFNQYASGRQRKMQQGARRDGTTMGHWLQSTHRTGRHTDAPLIPVFLSFCLRSPSLGKGALTYK